MSPLVLALLAIISVGAAGIAFVPTVLGSSRADKRREALKGDYQLNREAIASSRQREMRRKTVQEALKSQSEDQKRRKNVPLQTRIFQAGMKTEKKVFIRNSVILGVVLFVTCFILEVPIYFAAIIGASGGYVLPRFFLNWRRKRFQQAFLDELPNAVEAIVRGVKSGMPLNDSVRIVAREVKEPVRSEFARLLDQQAFGKSMAEAVPVLFERLPLPEVNFFVVVITVQQQSGGNLSEALGNLAKVLRARKAMKAKVKAMSSEAKASAMIIGSLPFIVAVLVSMVTPSYLTPLFSTNIGLLWLGGAAVMMAFGSFVMNRMIQFDV